MPKPNGTKKKKSRNSRVDTETKPLLPSNNEEVHKEQNRDDFSSLKSIGEVITFFSISLGKGIETVDIGIITKRQFYLSSQSAQGMTFANNLFDLRFTPHTVNSFFSPKNQTNLHEQAHSRCF